MSFYCCLVLFVFWLWSRFDGFFKSILDGCILEFILDGFLSDSPAGGSKLFCFFDGLRKSSQETGKTTFPFHQVSQTCHAAIC